MRKFIKHIQGQEYEQRKRWLILLCTIAGLLVIGIWILSMRALNSDVVGKSETATTENGQASTLESLGQKIKAGWNKAKADISSTVIEFKKAASSTQFEAEAPNP